MTVSVQLSSVAFDQLANKLAAAGSANLIQSGGTPSASIVTTELTLTRDLYSTTVRNMLNNLLTQLGSDAGTDGVQVGAADGSCVMTWNRDGEGAGDVLVELDVTAAGLANVSLTQGGVFVTNYLGTDGTDTFAAEMVRKFLTIYPTPLAPPVAGN